MLERNHQTMLQKFLNSLSDIKEVKLTGHDIRWSDPVKMRLQKVRHEFFNFDGIPFMCVANMAMSCQFGTGESEKAYQKRAAKRVSVFFSSYNFFSYLKSNSDFYDKIFLFGEYLFLLHWGTKLYVLLRQVTLMLEAEPRGALWRKK